MSSKSIKVEVDRTSLKSEVKSSIKKEIANNEDKIREFVERELIENDRLSIQNQIVKGVDKNDPKFTEKLDGKVTDIINKAYNVDEKTIIKVIDYLDNKFTSLVRGVKKNTYDGGKIVVKNISDFMKYAEELSFARSWKKRALSDMIMGGIGGIAISGIAITIAMSIAFPAQTAAAIGVTMMASFAGMLTIGTVKNMIPKMKNLINSIPT